MHGVKNTCAHLTDMHKIVLDIEEYHRELSISNK